MAVLNLGEIDEALLSQIDTLEPFGSANPEPILKAEQLLVVHTRTMGADAQHLKLELQDSNGITMQFLAFNAPKSFFVELGERVTVWFQPSVNEWQGKRSND